MYTIIIDKKTGHPLNFAPTAGLTERDVKARMAELSAPMRKRKEKRREVVAVEAATPPPFQGAKWDFDKGDWRLRDRVAYLVNRSGRSVAVVKGYSDDKLLTPIGSDKWVDKPKPKHIKNCIWDEGQQEWIRPPRALVVDGSGVVINKICVGALGLDGLTPPEGCTLQMAKDDDIGIGWKLGADGSFLEPDPEPEPELKEEKQKV